MPAFTDDLLAEYGGELVLRAKGERATVGFCGHVGTSGNRLYENVVGLLRGNRDKAIGMQLRHRALETLRASPRIETRFIARSQIWGGASTGAAQWDAARRAAVRREYLENIVESDYCLCLRGKGNYSFRFYEVFAMGRVPLFVDTDCVLPFEDEIDWRRRCVWVDRSEMDRIGDVVADFHAARSDEELRQLELDNRKLWEDYLSPSSIYARILDRALSSTARAASA
jgi:hypothetical protein